MHKSPADLTQPEIIELVDHMIAAEKNKERREAFADIRFAINTLGTLERRRAHAQQA